MRHLRLVLGVREGWTDYWSAVGGAYGRRYWAGFVLASITSTALYEIVKGLAVALWTWGR